MKKIKVEEKLLISSIKEKTYASTNINKTKKKLFIKNNLKPKKGISIFLCLIDIEIMFLLIFFITRKTIYFIKTKRKKIITGPKILEREEALNRGLPFAKKCLEGTLIKNKTFDKKFDNPKISVIMPCYNCIKYIKSSLRSVQNQDMDEIEIIIQNDYSNNETFNYLNELKKEDARIEIYNNSKNMNLFYTRSKGVLHAKGKYVITIDADDLFVDSDVFDIVYSAAEDGNFDIISFRIFMVSSFSNRNRISEHVYNSKEHNLTVYQPELSCYVIATNGKLISNDLNIWGKLFRTSIYKSAVNILGEERISYPLMWEEDVCMLFTISNVASSYKYIRKYGLFYRYHADSHSSVLSEDVKSFSTLVKLEIELDFAKKECYNIPAMFMIKNNINFKSAKSNRTIYHIKKVVKKIIYSDKIDEQYKNAVIDLYKEFLPKSPSNSSLNL